MDLFKKSHDLNIFSSAVLGQGLDVWMLCVYGW